MQLNWGRDRRVVSVPQCRRARVHFQMGQNFVLEFVNIILYRGMLPCPLYKSLIYLIDLIHPMILNVFGSRLDAVHVCTLYCQDYDIAKPSES